MEKDGLIEKKARAKREGNMLQLAEATKDLGDHYFVSNNYGKSIEEYSESVEIYETLEDKLNCAIVHRMIGEVNACLGKFESSLNHLNLHLESAKELKNEVEQQRGFATLGRTYFLLAHTFPERSDKRVGALASAKKSFNKSILLCNGLKGISRKELMTMRARLLLNQGLVQEAQMEPSAGIKLIKSAIEIFSANKLSDDLHRAHLTLGALYGKHGNNNLALKALDRAATTENKSKKVEAILAKAEFFLKSGQWLNARKVLVALYPDKSLSQSKREQLDKLLRIAVTLCRGEEQLSVRNTELTKLKLYEDLGDAASAAHCYNMALEYYKKMLFYAEKVKSPEKVAAALVSLAQTLNDAGRYEEALPFAHREYEMCCDPREACKSALLLAELLELAGSMNFEIIKMYKEALSKAEISGDSSLEAKVLKEYLQYLDSEKSKIETRLNTLSEQTPDIESEKAIANSQNIGADIRLDELSDIENSEEERKTEKPSGPKSMQRGKSGLAKFRVKRNARGETPLHTACIKGNIERVQQLLFDGHPTNIRDNAGWTPLHEASNHGFVDIVRLLISAGSDVNDSGDPIYEGVTPLHDAATNGKFSVMDLLIAKGADVHAITRKGESVLDSLTGFRKRVKNWPQEAESEYERVRRKLISRGVACLKENRSSLVD